MVYYSNYEMSSKDIYIKAISTNITLTKIHELLRLNSKDKCGYYNTWERKHNLVYLKDIKRQK